MKAKYKMNLVTGAVLFAFALFYFAVSFRIANFKGLGAPPIDAKFVPRLWGVMLCRREKARGATAVSN